MALTLGFSCGWGGTVTPDTPIDFPEGVNATTYVLVTGTPGTIRFKNVHGEIQETYGFEGYNMINAKEIIAAGTTATGLYWLGSTRY